MKNSEKNKVHQRKRNLIILVILIILVTILGADTISGIRMLQKQETVFQKKAPKVRQ